MKDKVIKAVDYLGGKKVYLIVAGAILVVFLVISIFITVSDTPSSTVEYDETEITEADSN